MVLTLKAYVVLNDNDEKVVMSARNLPNVQTALTNTINVYDVMKVIFFNSHDCFSFSIYYHT